MLIIPAERGIDWRRAPVVTGALILICCVVYFAWQWHDDQRLYKAAEYYIDHLAGTKTLTEGLTRPWSGL